MRCNEVCVVTVQRGTVVVVAIAGATVVLVLAAGAEALPLLEQAAVNAVNTVSTNAPIERLIGSPYCGLSSGVGAARQAGHPRRHRRRSSTRPRRRTRQESAGTEPGDRRARSRRARPRPATRGA